MKHILIVDDNKINLIVAKKVVGADYKVTSVTSGEQALAFFAENTCDLVLLDINMPEMDGFEVFDRLKETGSSVPVIFLTAESDGDVEEKCLSSGAAGFAEKPFDSQSLLEKIKAVIGE
ncbi:MAG: response regulator [Oscillospiraceae bacterium]|nr:response regulator [Oscillospiraceae bacterium]